MTLRNRIYVIIFGTDTPAGKSFDILLITTILMSVVILMLTTIEFIDSKWHDVFVIAEWTFTLFFTLEYIARIYASPKPIRYISSFYGVVDLLSILPSYVGLVYPEASHLLIIRILRVLRIFRVLKLVRYVSEANVLLRSMAHSKRKILIFFSSVLVLATIFGALMYIVEGPDHGFTSIPKSIYWTIVTITTVGYGDVVPQTPLGQVISALAMLTGYSIIAVPTGILTAEIAVEMNREKKIIHCVSCEKSGHDANANYCKFCGTSMSLSERRDISGT